MNSEEYKDFYEKQIKPLFDDWREADKRYWKQSDQLFTTAINGKVVSEATKFLPEDWEKLWRLDYDLKEKKKNLDEAMRKWQSLLR